MPTLELQRALRRRILSTCELMNFWPPKPGLTLMMSTRSTISMTCACTGVDARRCRNRHSSAPLFEVTKSLFCTLNLAPPAVREMFQGNIWGSSCNSITRGLLHWIGECTSGYEGIFNLDGGAMTQQHTSSMVVRDVPGLSTTPAFTPRSLICSAQTHQ